LTSRDGVLVSFTVSVGVAEFTGSGDLPSLLARADLAMYEAKKAGGACFRISEDLPTAAGARSLALSLDPRAP
jgi:PleD family two-component response regulator